MSDKHTYTASEEGGAVIVEGRALLYPDNEFNRKAGRTTQCELNETEAARFGDRLIKLGSAKSAEATKTKPAEATKTK